MSTVNVYDEMTDSEILEALNNIKEDEEDDRLSENKMKQFERVTYNLSRLLPKVGPNCDASINQIDDILYQHENLTDSNSSRFDSNESGTKISTDSVISYLDTYAGMIYKGEQPVNPYAMDMTCLQIADYSPKTIEEHENLCYELEGFIYHKMKTRKIDAICLSLKIMKISLTKNRDVMLGMFQGYLNANYAVLMVQKLVNIPQARLPRERRITNWLSQQASSILEIIDMKSFELSCEVQRFLGDDNDYVSQLEVRNMEHYRSGRQLDIEYLARRPKGDSLPYLLFYCDHFYNFFMASKSREERIQRIKEFFMTCRLWKNRVTRFLFNFCSRFVSDFLVNIDVQNKVYPDSVMRAMERRYGFEIEDYLTGAKMNTDEVLGEVKYESNDNGGSISQIPAEDIYTIENYLFFDSFKKELQLLNVFHSACMICQELCDSEGDVSDYDGRVFRGYRNGIIRYITKAFDQPKHCGPLPWIIEVVSKICPFLILPKIHEYLLSDLIKWLKGEEIDEYTEEELFFCFSCVNDW